MLFQYSCVIWEELCLVGGAGTRTRYTVHSAWYTATLHDTRTSALRCPSIRSTDTVHGTRTPYTGNKPGFVVSCAYTYIQVRRILCSSVGSQARNISNLTVTLSQFSILSCSENLACTRRLMSEALDLDCTMRPMSEALDLVALCCCVAKGCIEPRGSSLRERLKRNISTKFECGCAAMLVRFPCVRYRRTCIIMFSFHRNLGIYDRTYDCLQQHWQQCMQ